MGGGFCFEVLFYAVGPGISDIVAGINMRALFEVGEEVIEQIDDNEWTRSTIVEVAYSAGVFCEYDDGDRCYTGYDYRTNFREEDLWVDEEYLRKLPKPSLQSFSELMEELTYEPA